MRALWQRLRRAWRRSKEREDEVALDAALFEHELATRRSKTPEEPLPLLQGNSLGPV
jgi:hypothetical protein